MTNTNNSFLAERRQVSEMMARLYRTRLTTTSGGNISLRLDGGLFCITPSGLDKAALSPEQIAIVTLDGENLTPHLKLSIESEMHRLLLRARPDVGAVVHAHPCWATLFSAMDGLRIRTDLIAESFFLLGDILTIPYHRMGSPALAEEVCRAMAGGANVGIMENHGVIALGAGLVQAFDLVEVLENAAKATLAAEILGPKAGLRPLDEGRKASLIAMKAGK